MERATSFAPLRLPELPVVPRLRKANCCSTIAVRANAVRSGLEAEFDAALDTFCDTWNRGTNGRARFEKEYLLAVGTRV